MVLCLLVLSSCYNHRQHTPDAWDLTKQQIDSISFSTTHHYSQNYNFVVNVSSLSTGSYLFRINTANGFTTKNVVVVR